MPALTVTIDGRLCNGEKGETILQLAKKNDIEIPTLCHDERVKTYGACGLCIVEVQNVPRLLRACATEITDGMVITTNSEKIYNSRKIALELLLSDHRGDCRPPCSLACPGELDCQGYVGLIANEENSEALKLINEKLPLPSSIGRVCPHPCETACRRKMVEEPISICRLKAFVGDKEIENSSVNRYIPHVAKDIGKSVAIVGGGPGGLTAAYFLRRNGVKVTVYDAMEKMGGMLRYGIPEYRLPKTVLDKEISAIEGLGVQFKNSVCLGKDISLSNIQEENDAVIIAVGAWKSSSLGCTGEEHTGVLGGIDFLCSVAQNDEKTIEMIKDKKVAVVGGGNTSMDTCRTAVRLGAATVYNIYRRTKEEMPAEKIEIHEAEEEGVIFKFLTNPIEIAAVNDKVTSIKLQKMELGAPDKSGRRSPLPIEGEVEWLDVDFVIMSIGQALNPEGLSGIELTNRKTIKANENNFTTNIPGVFAVGDATNKGADIAISAVGEARRAANVVLNYLICGEVPSYKKPFCVTQDDLTKDDFKEHEKASRHEPEVLPPQTRKSNFCEVAKGFDNETAKKEASRCLSCGCADYFECSLIRYANDYAVKPQRFNGVQNKRAVSTSHPFIDINPNKCILCGLCVRVCDEVTGRAALGLVNRGFETSVKPSFSRPLCDTECISCGQCVHLCPTGALTEKLNINKPVPLEEDTVETVCSFCSLGCKMVMHYKGKTLIRCTPYGEDGLLCAKGRFGFNAVKGKELTVPIIEGKESSWEQAYIFTAERLKKIICKYGQDSVIVTVSDKYTNEEMYQLKQLTGKLYSFNMVLGSESDKTPKDIDEAKTIIVFGTDIYKTHTVAAFRIRKAILNGAKLIVVNNKKTILDEMAYKKITVENDITSENFKAVINEIADICKNSDNALIIADQKELAPAAYKSLKGIGGGLLVLKQNANSQGLFNIGATPINAEILKRAVESQNAKALLVFGEDPGIDTSDINGLEFILVQDSIENSFTSKASVVLPRSEFANITGTYTNTGGEVQKVNTGMTKDVNDNREVLSKIAEMFDIEEINDSLCFNEYGNTNAVYSQFSAFLEKM